MGNGPRHKGNAPLQSVSPVRCRDESMTPVLVDALLTLVESTQLV